MSKEQAINLLLQAEEAILTTKPKNDFEKNEMVAAMTHIHLAVLRLDENPKQENYSELKRIKKWAGQAQNL